jgi:hypothetical protein
MWVMLKVNYFPHQMAITLAEKRLPGKIPEKLNNKRQLLRDHPTITA